MSRTATVVIAIDIIKPWTRISLRALIELILPLPDTQTELLPGDLRSTQIFKKGSCHDYSSRKTNF
jgi:hypothetical protein